LNSKQSSASSSSSSTPNNSNFPPPLLSLIPETLLTNDLANFRKSPSNSKQSVGSLVNNKPLNKKAHHLLHGLNLLVEAENHSKDKSVEPNGDESKSNSQQQLLQDFQQQFRQRQQQLQQLQQQQLQQQQLQQQKQLQQQQQLLQTPTTHHQQQNLEQQLEQQNLEQQQQKGSKTPRVAKTPKQTNSLNKPELPRTLSISELESSLQRQDSDDQMENLTGDSSVKKRRYSTKEMTPEERRVLYLERNKAAAAKCRSRKKQWLQDTQEKNEHYLKSTSELRVQLARLKSEQQLLKEQLRSKPCRCEQVQRFLDVIEAMEQQESQNLTTTLMSGALGLGMDSESQMNLSLARSILVNSESGLNINLGGEDSMSPPGDNDDLSSEDEREDGNL